MIPRYRNMRRRMQQNKHDESGFTLAELILSIAIETIIFGALATAFVVVLQGGNSINENLGKSNDARFAANFMISDARNASGPETSLTDTTLCPDPTPPVAGPQTPIARFMWDATDADGTVTHNIANYVLVGTSLMRRYCDGVAPVRDSVLGSDVQGVTVTCAPSATPECSGAPASITVTITETPNKAGGTPFTYTLTAAFRKAISNGGSLTPPTPHPVILLGGPCGGTTGISVVGGSSMRVYGDAYINTADGTGCHAMELDGSSSYSAGSTSILTGGACSEPAWATTCPATTPYSPAIGDPYAGLTPPSTTGMTVQPNMCGGFGAKTALPGVYPAAFSPGGGVTCTLSSGIYVMQNGFNTGGGGVTIQSAAGGVLIYVTGGAINIAGGSTVNLTPMTTGTYAGMAMWQAAADVSPLTWDGGATIVINGVLYAPKAGLVLAGGGNVPAVNVIVVRTITISNSGDLVIGTPSPTPLSITTGLKSWTVNRAYSATLAAAGGDSVYKWSLSGTLPTGLTFNANTGVVSGTPTVVGSSTVTITLKDALGDDPVVQSNTITVNAVPVITTVSPLPPGQRTVPYTATIATTGGTTPFAWTISPLPAGVTYNNVTGVISGTPTAAGTTTVTAALTDAAGATVSKGSLTLVMAAAPTITSVTLANVSGGIAGRVEKGDTIKVIFSAAMKVSSICSTWTTDTSNQVLTADADVVNVTLTDATKDTISITTATCTFNFGLLDLGVGTYVSSGNAVFGGTGTNKSLVTYTVSTRTLLITLGTKGATGTVATVATSTPIYTAGAMRDTGGGSFTNSPLALAAGIKF